MKKMNSESLNLTEEKVNQLKEILPEAFIEGEKIDFQKLRLLLGDKVETSKERYNFTWHGKKESILGAQKPSKGTLRPDREKSKNFDTTENLYIEGDNLETLKLLQKSYNNKVKVIYIDPPYNTGNDFVYKDNFKEGIDNYLEQTGQVDSEGNQLSTNNESQGRYHSNWLNMMYPRLKLARNLLTDDGLIFISIDDREVDSLKKVSNEILGEKNFQGMITWNKKRKGSFLSKGIISLTEYILVYSKNFQYNLGIYGSSPDSTESQPIIKRTNKVSRLVIPPNTIKTKLKDGIYRKGIYGEDTNPVELITDAIVRNKLIINELIIKAPFTWSQKMFDLQLEEGAEFIINTINFQLRVFRVFEETNFKGFPSYIDGKSIKGTNEDAYEELNRIFKIKKIFDYSKPKNLIKKLLDGASHFDKDAIILDFFSGSASTAQAIMELNAEDGGNRKFIMVQLPEPLDEKSEAYKEGYRNICDIGEERIRRAGEKVKKDLIEKNNKEGLLEENQVDPNSLDIGFKVFKLDKSNIKEWNIDFENIDQLDLYEDVFVEERSELDVVYEILLKNGIELTYPITTFEVDGKPIYDIAYGNLFICLADNIDTSVAKAITDKRNEYAIETSSVVFKDAGFGGNDSEKLNVIEILKDAGYADDQLLTI